MESNEDVEVLSRAIEKLLDEKRKREAAGDAFIEDHDDQLLLSRLISQLGSPKTKGETDGITKEEEEEGETDVITKEEEEEEEEEEEGETDVITKEEEEEEEEGETDVITKEEEEKQSSDSSASQGKPEGDRRLEESLKEIAKDIKNVKRQNTRTHMLLSAVIFLTLAWQVSQYSMILMMKDRISHPIRSIGGMLNGIFKGKLRPIENQLTGTSTSKDQDNNGNGTLTGAQLQMPELLREFGFDADEE